MPHVGANIWMLLSVWSICASALKLHADLYASPKYAINFSVDAISEEDLSIRLAQLGSTGEQLSFGNRRTLCSLPASNLSTISNPNDEELQSPPQPVNGQYGEHDSTELLAIQENGWKLLQSLKGHCLYYTLNYFTYSLCFGDEVRQFRAISHKGLIPYPPMPDPGSANFLLGRFNDDDWKASTKVKLSEEMPYLSQKIGHGSICDLTEKERNVEVQYFCNLDTPNDKIISVTEVSTCNYRMIIHTRKLCADPSFLPAKQGPPLYITCWPILNSTEIEQYNKARNEGRLASNDLMADISKSFGLISSENGLGRHSEDQEGLEQQHEADYLAFSLESIDERERMNTFMSNIMEMILFKLSDLLVNENSQVRLALNEEKQARVIAVNKNGEPVAIVGIQDRDNHLVAFMGNEPLGLEVDSDTHHVITMVYDAQEKILEVIDNSNLQKNGNNPQEERTMSFDNELDENPKIKTHDEL